MKFPQISIIIPVYNKQQYVSRCISSLLNQSYKDYELIIVNDGSTDGSRDICMAFENERIRLYDLDNGGVSRARNYGLDVARGEYVLFVDSDDWVDKDYISHLMRDAEGRDFDIMIFGLTRVYLNGERKKVEMPDWTEREFYQQYMYLQDVLSEGITGFVCNKLIRRSFINQYSIRFDTKIRMAEDVNFYLDVLRNNPTIITSRECGYYYLQEADNSSFFQKNVDFFSLMAIWRKCYMMLESKGYGEADNRQRLYQKIFELFGAHFLEEPTNNVSKVQNDLKKMYEQSASLPLFWSIVEPTNFLLKMIRRKSFVGIFLYLSLRKMYHIIRWHHR